MECAVGMIAFAVALGLSPVHAARLTHAAELILPLKEMRNVRYGNSSWNKMDLYWPDVGPQDPGFQAFVTIHGMPSSKLMHRSMCRRIARLGRFCVAVEYRWTSFFTKTGNDKMTADVRQVVQWVRTNALQYNVNRDNIILYGYSLGGMIINNLLWKDELFSQNIKAAIIQSGVKPHHVEMAHAGGPPILFIHCSNDFNVRYTPAEDLYEKLKGVGEDVKIWKCRTAHFPALTPGWWEQIKEFVDSHSAQS